VLGLPEVADLTPRDRAALDVNGDLRITMIDVMRIVQAAATNREDLPCSLRSVWVPVGLAGVPYAYELPDEDLPPEAQIIADSLQGSTAVHLDPATRRLEATVDNPCVIPFELDIQGPDGRAARLAIDLEFVLPTTPDRDLLPTLHGTEPPPLILTELGSDLSPPQPATPEDDIHALCVTPRSWRSGPHGILLLAAVGDQVKTILLEDHRLTGEVGHAPRPPLGGAVTGMVFVDDVCYLICREATLFRLDRDPETGELLPSPVLQSALLQGATSLVVHEVEGVPVGLVATIDDPSTIRHLVWVPLGVQQPELSARLTTYVGISGGCYAGAFIRNLGESAPVLLTRQDLPYLTRWEITATGVPEPRQPEQGVELPPRGPLDDLVASSDGRSLIHSSGVPDPAAKDPAENLGVWMTTFGSGQPSEPLLRGFEADRPAGALTIGLSSLGTGQSLFVAGNGAIYEIFGKRDGSLRF
jgi:hypothetical protein